MAGASAFFFGLPSVKHGHHTAHLPKAVRRLPLLAFDVNIFRLSHVPMIAQYVSQHRRFPD
jgi:hypothetical protein